MEMIFCIDFLFTVDSAGKRSAGIAGTGVRLSFEISGADHALGELIGREKVAVDVFLDASLTGEYGD